MMHHQKNSLERWHLFLNSIIMTIKVLTNSLKHTLLIDFISSDVTGPCLCAHEYASNSFGGPGPLALFYSIDKSLLISIVPHIHWHLPFLT